MTDALRLCELQADAEEARLTNNVDPAESASAWANIRLPPWFLQSVRRSVRTRPARQRLALAEALATTSSDRNGERSERGVP